jgi:diguanylate cyclase (GGDEF)-like protein
LLTDKLTGLYNKTFLDDDFPRLMHEYGETFSILAIKPDNFKEINDTYGHDAGDKMLTLLAVFIHSALEANDIAIRYKGDEFIVILPHTSYDAAISRAEEVRSTIASMDVKHITNGPFSILTSIGVSTFPHHAVDDRALVESAVKKMYEIRNKGGDGVYG